MAHYVHNRKDVMTEMNFKKYITMLALSLVIVPCLFSADKYAGEIFYMSPGVSNQAMGNTGVTNEDNISAAWWNPALLALDGNSGIELMHAEQFEGLMQFNHISTIIGKQNRIGLVITHIGINDVKLTRLVADSLVPSSINQPYVWKKVNNNDLMAYFGIGSSISSKLHFGITPKLVYRSLAEKNGFGFGGDWGILWQISRTFNLGLVARNFLTTKVVWENGTQEDTGSSVDTEVSFSKTISKKQIPIYIALATEIQTDGRQEAATLNSGPFSADFHAGIAVKPIPQLKIMAGYDIDTFTTGLGLSFHKMGIEYAIKLGSDDDLGYSQRIAAGYRW